MIAKAKEYKEAGKFEAAFNSATAAMQYSLADKYEVETLMKEIFFEINQLRTQAEIANEKANEATRKALESADIAKMEKSKALKAKAEADSLRDIAIDALARVDTLVREGKALERTFSDSSAYSYLYQTGLHHFAFDTMVQQSRDYRTALTYFALARFLKPSDTLRYLVDACQIGNKAEADFIDGNLDSAGIKYRLIQSKLDSAQLKPHFEEWRLGQIVQVKALYQDFKRKYGGGIAGSVPLEGNWWTLPNEFRTYRGITKLIISNNPSNFKKFPAALSMLENLGSLVFTDCPNVRELKDWDKLKQLRSLTFSNNPNLYTIENLDTLKALASISVVECPALTVISGCVHLKRLSVLTSPQARVSDLLLQNPQLEKLELADLPDTSLNISKLTSLESLSLARMKTSNLQGLEKNIQLRKLKIEALDSLFALKPPAQVSEIYISKCHSLVDLSNWPVSDTLNKLVLLENKNLKTLPEWQQFPNLKTLLIQNNNGLTQTPNTRSLENIDRIYVLNNPNFVTNSLHFGFGFDWDLHISSGKVELEHRRRIQRKVFKYQDFGFKATATYTRKYFYTPSPSIVKKKTEGWILGAVANYYSPYLIYTGLGIGFANLNNVFSDQSNQRTKHFIWINTLGVEVAPRLWRRNLLRKDKISLNMDLFTISNDDKFISRDYFILPSFGLTYHLTLGFHRKANFVRINESRRHTFFKGKELRVEDLPDEVWKAE